MMGVVELLWLVLTVIVCTMDIISLLQPNWLLNPKTTETVGLLTHCLIFGDMDERMCTFYDESTIFKSFPSHYWQVVVFMYALASGLMVFSVMAGIYSAIHLNMRPRHMVAVVVSYMQCIAGW